MRKYYINTAGKGKRMFVLDGQVYPSIDMILRYGLKTVNKFTYLLFKYTGINLAKLTNKPDRKAEVVTSWSSKR